MLAALGAACSGEATGPTATSLSGCSIPLERFVDAGTERSSIPALKNPQVAKRLVAPLVGYVSHDDLVIGLIFNGQPVAIPMKLLWYHEVVNFEVPGERLTVTYSPLTGSSLVFDPASSGAGDFDVSPYVLGTNLVMEDGSGTLFPQMAAAATCGPADGVSLVRMPYEQIRYGAWLLSYPDTWIVGRATGFDFLYTLYPYGDYNATDNTRLLYPISGPLDGRRPPKERVLGVPSGTGGVAFPITAMAQAALQDEAQAGQPVLVWAARADAGGTAVVVFWNSIAGSVVAYRALTGGQQLTFEVVDGARTDLETGSVWNYAGQAVSGPLEGAQLPPHPDAYHAFWFAWAEFQPDTEVWEPPFPLSAVPAADILAPPSGPIDWELSRR